MIVTHATETEVDKLFSNRNGNSIVSIQLIVERWLSGETSNGRGGTTWKAAGIRERVRHDATCPLNCFGIYCIPQAVRHHSVIDTSAVRRIICRRTIWLCGVLHRTLLWLIYSEGLNDRSRLLYNWVVVDGGWVLGPLTDHTLLFWVLREWR